MSQENVEIVRRAHEAWNNDDFDAFLPLVSEEIEWQTALATGAEGVSSVYRGRGAAERVWNDYRDLFDEFRTEDLTFVDLGDRVLVLSYARTRGRGSGVELREELAQLITIGDGRIVRAEDFRSHAEGREAAGLARADIEALRAGYEAFNLGDWETAFRNADPDVELKTADRVTNPGTYRGLDEIRRFFEDLFEPFEEVVTEPQEFFERGNRIAVFVLVRLRPRGSSAVVENRIGHLWTVRDGKIVRFEIFPEREKALEAAGRSEQDARSDVA
jgi:ketosteroid isomerase-like protein